MHVHDSKVNKNKGNANINNNNNNNNTSSSGRSSGTSKNHQSHNQNSKSSPAAGRNNSALDRSGQNNDVNLASVMSEYTLIDEDHIDDQETINVGNLIIDLESDLEKEKIENEQANNAKSTSSSVAAAASSSSSSSTTYSTSNVPSSSSSSFTPSFVTKASSSTTCNSPNTPIGKLNQKSSNKHSNNFNTGANTSATITTTTIINNNNHTSSTINNNHTNSNNNTNTSNTVECSSLGIVNNNNNASNSNNGHLMTTRTVFKSDERGELKMRITRETKPGKSEHKIVTSPNQKSPTSSCNSNNPSNSSSLAPASHANNCEELGFSETLSKLPQTSSISSTKECGTSTSIGTITEPDCLGPCEPGTSVTLEGIVWQETEGGILVVNVTWRGKTYVGALLDCTKHDWAPPRLCDSPASDIDSKTHKGVRTKRVVTRSNGIGLDEKNLLQTTGKLRNGKGRRILSSTDPASCNKRQRSESDKPNENLTAQSEANTSMASISSITSSENVCVPMNIDTVSATSNESILTSNISSDKAGPNSPMLIGCNEPNCSKKYRNINGLLYHQTHAHGSENESNNAQETNCSSSINDKVNETEELKDQDEEKETELPIDNNSDRRTHNLSEQQPKHDQSQEMKLPQVQEKRRTPSPQLIMKSSNKLAPESSTRDSNTSRNQELRTSIVKNMDSSLNSNQNISHADHSRRSPGVQSRHMQDHGHSSSNHHSSSKSSSGSSKQSNPAPLPATTEEGMKPSGTSTGPPPAPHQGNCYFTGFMANTFNPYGLGSYFPRSQLPIYPDPLAPATSSANAAMLSRFMSNMNNMRHPPPPPVSPSRLLSPSIPKLSPYPPFKVEPGPMHAPTSQLSHPLLPNMPPLPNPPHSPHLRMPSQGDPMLPPTSQPFPHPLDMNPVLGFPGSVNPMGPIGGPQVPSLVDDPLAKQFPRRFN